MRCGFGKKVSVVRASPDRALSESAIGDEESTAHRTCGRVAEWLSQCHFVHLTRDPRKLFHSTVRLWLSLDEVQGLQLPKPARRDARVRLGVLYDVCTRPSKLSVI